MDVSVVIPCYRSPKSLEERVALLSKMLSKLGEFEILLVCDDCPDGSWVLIKKIAAKNRNVKGVLLGQNVGQSRCTFFGIKRATGNIVVTMDDDGQHSIEELPYLMAKFREGYDAVYVLPLFANQNLFRRLASYLFRKTFEFLRLRKNASMLSSFRIINGNFVRNFSSKNSFQSDIDWILNTYTSRITSIKIKMNKREEGKSNYNFMRLAKHAQNLLINSNENLVAGALSFGIMSLFASLAVSILTTVRYLRGDITVPGYTTLILFQSLCFASIFVLIAIVGKHLYQSSRAQLSQEEIWVREVTN